MFCFWIRAVSVGQHDIACCSSLPDRFGLCPCLQQESPASLSRSGQFTPLVSLCWPCIGEAIAGFAHPNKHASTPSHNESAVAVIDRKPSCFIQTVGYQSFREKDSRDRTKKAADIKERGIDLLAPIWHFMDLAPQGRGNWYASLEYGTKIQAAAG
jgi:hypothetical protein